MKKLRIIPVMILTAIVAGLLGGCQLNENNDMASPVRSDRPSSTNQEPAMIPIAKVTDQGAVLLKKQEAYWGYFRTNAFEDDPTRIQFRTDSRGVRVIQHENLRLAEKQWQLAVEAYWEEFNSDVLFRMELTQEGNMLFVPNGERVPMRVSFCPDSEKGCSLEFKENGDVARCFNVTTNTKCPMSNRHFNYPQD